MNKTQRKKLSTALRAIAKSHTQKERTNGEKYWVFEDKRAWEWFGKYPNGPLDPSQENTYEWVGFALPAIADALDEDALDEYDPGEAADEIVDVYTADLITWLGSNLGNVEYLTEAAKEYGITDGFELLKMAQYCHIRDVLCELLRCVQSIEKVDT